MSALQRMAQRAQQADQLLAYLKSQVATLRASAIADACRTEEERLHADNAKLKREVEDLKQQLIAAEAENGIHQVGLPQRAANASATTPAPAPAVKSEPAAEKQQGKKKEPWTKPPKTKNQPAASAAPVDVSRLDMRVGFIVTAKKHPDADGLYVEDVDLGEGKNRTIVSGLVKFVPLEKMQQRLAVFMVNLKPAKMRGILSEGMIMCGSSPELVEIIEVPEGAAIGDRVTVEGYPGEPDEMLKPKQKIWEQVQPDLKISESGVATYKGVPWNIGGKGQGTVPTMRNTIIK